MEDGVEGNGRCKWKVRLVEGGGRGEMNDIGND